MAGHGALSTGLMATLLFPDTSYSGIGDVFFTSSGIPALKLCGYPAPLSLVLLVGQALF